MALAPGPLPQVLPVPLSWACRGSTAELFSPRPAACPAASWGLEER